MNILQKINHYFAKGERVVMVVMVVVMIVLAFLQVTLRNVFGSGFTWADVFIRHLVLWVGFIGASLATMEGRHINIDIVSKLLSPSQRRWSELVTNLFATFISFMLSYASYLFVAMEKEAGSKLFMEIPTWIFQLILPLAFFVMGFRFFTRFLETALAHHLQHKHNRGGQK